MNIASQDHSNNGEMRLLKILMIFFIFNLYIEAPLPLTNSAFIPSFFILLTCVATVFVLRGCFIHSDYVYILFIVGFSAASTVLAPNWSDIGSRIWSAFQFFFASIVFISLIRLQSMIPSADCSKILRNGILIIAALMLLELTGITTSISDAFRQSVYVAGYSVYDSDARDIALTGFIRPKVFTAEPSLVVIGLLIFSTSYCAYNPSGMRIIFTCAISSFSYFATKSPIALVIPAPALLIWISRKTDFSTKIIFFVAGTILAIALAFSINGSFSTSTASAGRFDFARLFNSTAADKQENESSEKLRLVYPYLAVRDTFLVNPLTGLGIGGKRSLELYSTVTDVYPIAFGNNAFATIFIFFGALGGIIFIIVFLRYCEAVSIGGLSLYFSLFVFLQTMGAFEGARLWGYIALLLGPYVYRYDRSGTPIKRNP